jgi:FHA domain/Nuclease-related domain
MTLKIYVAGDKDGKEWPPDKPQEVQALEWMLKKAWAEFQPLLETYAIVVNLEHPNPSADLLVIREIGLGVLELKHYFGEITVGQDGIWRAGQAVIKSGIHLNPREQVKSYAARLRGMLVRELLPPRMQMNSKHWNDLKFQTGVCFTNPRAKLEAIRKYLKERPARYEDWESDFLVFDLDFFTTWVRELRFHLARDPGRDFSPLRLTPDKIEHIVKVVLGAVEWQEMVKAMPTAKPYGYLILEDEAGREVFNLTDDRMVIGRSRECDVVLPARYGRVGKIHLEIVRNVTGITITDLRSRNGTFVNNRLVQPGIAMKLSQGSTLSLGGPPTGDKACVLIFRLQGEISDETTITEEGTREVG